MKFCLSWRGGSSSIIGHFRARTLALISFLAVGCALAQTPPPVAIVNARVVTVSGPVLDRATVILRNHTIEAVGENLRVPADAELIAGEGLTVYPGLIDGLGNWALPPVLSPPLRRRGQQIGNDAPQLPPSRGPEDRPLTFSWIKAADEI